MSDDLILASNSFARQNMLRDAGYDFDIIPADIDEEKIINQQSDDDNISDVAMLLAREKSQFVGAQYLDKYIIGSDQVLVLKDKIYSKAKDIHEAKLRLKEFQGQSHVLYSAVSVHKNNQEIYSYCDKATLKMRKLNDNEIENYCAVAGDVLTSCVGCYALESNGIRLFERIEGDYFTILGMPLLPLIGALNKEGFTL